MTLLKADFAHSFFDTCVCTLELKSKRLER